jgi:uncharacterized protein YlzI (FlbEa/FlbD family)
MDKFIYEQTKLEMMKANPEGTLQLIQENIATIRDTVEHFLHVHPSKQVQFIRQDLESIKNHIIDLETHGPATPFKELLDDEESELDENEAFPEPELEN